MTPMKRSTLALRILTPLLVLCAASSFAFAQGFYVGFSSGEIVAVDSNGAHTPFGTVTSAQGMAVDSAEKRLVAEDTDNVVYKFTPSGTRTVFVSGVSAPSDVAIDSS